MSLLGDSNRGSGAKAGPEDLSESIRLLQGERGWWALREGHTARLPRWAVRRGDVSWVGRLALRNQGFYQPPAEDKRFYLTVVVATACNLGCGYCFQNVAEAPPGTNRPTRIPSTMLRPRETGRIIDFAAARMEANGLSELDLMLFGGEPLLNPRGCLLLLEAAKRLNLVNAQMVTNATVLTASLARELEERGLGSVQVTLDGNRDAHDRSRATRTGVRTFDRILANISAADAVTSWHWQIRLNVTPTSTSGIPLALRTLAEAISPARTTVTFGIVDDVGVGFDDVVRFEAETEALLIEWNLAALELGFEVKRPRAADRCGYCAERRGTRGAVVDGNGTLFSCWESVGKDDWEVGDVDEGYFPDDRVDRRWVSCGYTAKPHAGALERKRIDSRVDAAILDWLDAHSVPPAKTI